LALKGFVTSFIKRSGVNHIQRKFMFAFEIRGRPTISLLNPPGQKPEEELHGKAEV
jgi:hypothetical protein